MWGTLILLGVTTFILHYIYKNFLQKSSSWEKYGIRYVDASPAASAFEILTGKKDVVDRDSYAYDLLTSLDEKFCGMQENTYKLMVLRDVELIKKVLIKDFEYFSERRDFVDWAPEDHVMRKMLSTTKGEQWKNLRHTLSPAFTTGKIRRMMECFNIVGKEWVQDLTKRAKGSSSGSVKIEVMKSVNQYTVDVIALAVFGMRTGTIQNPASEFATQAFKLSNIASYKFFLGLFFPTIARYLGVEVFDLGAIKWFESILDQVYQQRVGGKDKKNDFLQMLLEARQDELKPEGEDELSEFEKDAQGHVKTGKKIQLTDDVLKAQSLMFFVAGFSTTSNFISFALYALAAHPEVQERLRKEVAGIAKDGNVDYDELGKLAYMEMFICELLRMYPAALRLERVCVKDYKDPETGLFVPKGAYVSIPVKSLHNDPKYYPNPEKFDPEAHFNPQLKAERSTYTFLPFGHGPRNCIGMRFAIIETKAAVAHIVHNFLVEPTETTPIPMKPDKASLQVLPPKGLELKLTPKK